MNKILSNILLTVISLVFITYFGFQLYRFTSKPYQTETVFSYTISDAYRTQALIFRDEVPIVAQSDGNAVRYIYNDATMVSKNQPVIELYQNDAAINTKNRMEDIQKEINALKQLEQYSQGQITHFDSINAQLSIDLIELGRMIDSKKLTNDSVFTTKGQGLNETKSDILIQLAKKQIVIGKFPGFTDRITELEAELNQLAANNVERLAQIPSPAIGYFCSFSDGLDGYFSTKAMEEMTLSDIKEGFSVVNSSADHTGIGKIINGFNWYFAAIVPSDRITRLREGSMLDVYFEDSVVPVKSEVYKIVTDKDKESGESAVLFKNNEMSSEISAYRVLSAEIRFRSYTGIRVDKRAIRFKDLDKGVYVVEKNVIRFKKIFDLYEEDGFVLSEIDEFDRSRIQKFDMLILDGKDLYDGKPLH